MSVIIEAKEYAFLLGIMYRCPNAQMRKRLNLTQQQDIKQRVIAKTVVLVAPPPVPPQAVDPAQGSPVMSRKEVEESEESKLTTD